MRAVLGAVVVVSMAIPSGQAQSRARSATASPHVSTAAAPEPAGDLFLRALHFEHGEGVAQDFSRARQLYCQAAKLGEPRAFLNLGWMYLNGRGVARNDAIAAMWLHKAAASGSSQAATLVQMLGNPKVSGDTGCRSSAAASLAEPPATPPEIRAIVQDIAPRMGLDIELVIAVIATESAFKSHAISRKDAMGLMQLMPETAARFGVQNPFDPVENIRGGTSYLQWLLQRFAGNVDLALAAYNAGEAAVDSYGGIPPFPETVQYVAQVERFYAVNTQGHSSVVLTRISTARLH